MSESLLVGAGRGAAAVDRKALQLLEKFEKADPTQRVAFLAGVPPQVRNIFLTAWRRWRKMSS